ncbi:extracellular solute-binding protein [Paenibacillus contaminans]|uniref:ABC transporter substrate-binding protein n=1 Tax=Paenibacillus contaminans TaxID=450362 RepID=A0A329MU47_9BACL|nr:extracellular solute-binding protein [Paenibacillus contaminans]RAV23100.1 hypothetical protein DQG23_02585 [Paenibacillus contaminans]
MLRAGSGRRLRYALAALALLMVVAAGCGQPGRQLSRAVSGEGGKGLLTPGGYLEWLGELRKTGVSDSQNVDIAITAEQFAAISDPAHFTGDEEGLLWSGENGWIEWKVSVPQDGFYNINAVYDAAGDRPVDIVRGLQIDGSYPYNEAENIRLKKSYVHDQYPFQKDEFGNHMRPRSIIAQGWKDIQLVDYSVDPAPLRFHLTKGEHLIRLVAVSEPMKLKSLRIQSPRILGEYAEPAAGQDLQGDWVQIVEAENIYRKSNTSIQITSQNHATISPSTGGSMIYNALGGEQFKQQGQWVEWRFEVPEAGYYEIGMKYLQSYLNQFYAFRTFSIDGVVPNQSMLNVGFPYSTEWHNMTLNDNGGQAMLFYLDQGEHTVRMTVNAATAMPIYQSLIRNIELISDLEYSIRKVTGNFDRSSGAGNIDLNRDWDLVKYIPDLNDRMNEIIDDLNVQAGRLAAMSTGTTDTENSFRMAVSELTKLRDHPREMANRLDVFTKIQSNLGTWLFRLQDQPLALDYLWVAKPGSKLPKAEPTMLQKLGHTSLSFIRTFTKDYDYRRKTPGAIDVWVNRGRDYADLIQRLADETFTRETGVAVNVNLVPDPNMFILGNAADIQPDVALGLDNTMPVDFAIRGSMLDLSRFDDFAEVAGRFRPEQMDVFSYDGGTYAIPENQNFSLLVYRKDILGALGLSAPDTWDDLYGMLPTLQQNGYNFYVNPKDHLPFMYQNGASYYTDDALESGLNTTESLQAFQQWTDLFTLYQLPSDLPGFFTHFRLGDIPIGIIDFNLYLQLQFAAPEIAGKWAIAPIPGTKKAEDGTIERWAGGAMQAGVIFQKTSRKEDAWRFLKWWTSDEIQARFGNEIEAQYGPEYRWNTANREALGTLPWPSKDLEIIQAQLEWYREIPQVPGGYFTARQLDFAWNDVVVAKKKAKGSLEKAFIDINREMSRKQIEFGLRDVEGNIVKKPMLPSVLRERKEGGEGR